MRVWEAGRQIGDSRLQIWPQSPRAPESSDLNREMYYRAESGRQAATLEMHCKFQQSVVLTTQGFLGSAPLG